MVFLGLYGFLTFVCNGALVALHVRVLFGIAVVCHLQSCMVLHGGAACAHLLHGVHADGATTCGAGWS